MGLSLGLGLGMGLGIGLSLGLCLGLSMGLGLGLSLGLIHHQIKLQIGSTQTQCIVRAIGLVEAMRGWGGWQYDGSWGMAC